MIISTYQPSIAADRIQLLEQLKDQETFKDLIKTATDLRHLISVLKDKEIPIIVHQHKNRLPNIINNLTGLREVLIFLDDDAIKKELYTDFKNAGKFKNLKA